MKSEEIINTKSTSFEELVVWQKSHQFVLHIYKLTEQFPRAEIFGLISQIRRAAVSIPANIAEGFKRKGRADKLRFFNISQGSLEEVRYYLILANDLGYGDTIQLRADLDEIGRMLNAYMKTVNQQM